MDLYITDKKLETIVLDAVLISPEQARLIECSTHYKGHFEGGKPVIPSFLFRTQKDRDRARADLYTYIHQQAAQLKANIVLVTSAHLTRRQAHAAVEFYQHTTR